MARSKKFDSEYLYTSAEVRKILGISPSTLTSLVDKGVIEKVVPVGYTNGFYTKKSVDEYREKQNVFMQTYGVRKVDKREN